jgi:hypothetical protein
MNKNCAPSEGPILEEKVPMEFGCHFEICSTSSISNLYEMSYNLQKVVEWMKGQGNLITFL